MDSNQHSHSRPRWVRRPGRRSRGLSGLVPLVVVALLMMVGACSSDGGTDETSNGTAATSGSSGENQADGNGAADESADEGTDDESGLTADEVCGLIPTDLLAELLGGPVAEPSPATGMQGNPSCSWELQKNVDDPDPTTIDRTVSLTVLPSPNPDVSSQDYFASMAKSLPPGPDVCDKSILMPQNQVTAIQGDVILGLHGLAEGQPDRDSVNSELITTACANLP